MILKWRILGSLEKYSNVSLFYYIKDQSVIVESHLQILWFTECRKLRLDDMSNIVRRIKEIRLENMASWKPSTKIIVFILISVSIFILGGGVYDIMLRPLSILPTPSQPIFYYSGMSDQTMTESISFMFFLIIGVLGGYVSFRSTRYAYRPREAKMYLAVGVAMLLFAFIGCRALLSIKGI